MDGRRHSVDLPISRTLVALRRVRSLRDPSTNCISKLSAALNDSSNWETTSSSAIFSGLENSIHGDENIVQRWRNSVQNVTDFREGTLEGLELGCLESAADCEEGRASCDDELDEILSSHSKCKDWHHKLDSFTGISCTGSPCVSTSKAPKRRSRNASPVYRNDDGCIMDFCHQGCGLSRCWSRNLKFRNSNLLYDAEETPLLMGNSERLLTNGKRSVYRHNGDGIIQSTESPRNLCQKFMPKSFKELVGQHSVATSLLGAISNQKITSLYLFHGSCGTGKTSASKIFAAALNCLSHETIRPCGICQECFLFFSGRSRDVKEIDPVRLNKMERCRSLIRNLGVPPILSRFKVYIIDECHILHHKTWAALLSCFEELPSHVVFIMITSNLDILPRPAISKAQKYHFQKVKEIDIIRRLEKICAIEGLEFEQDALSFIATKSNGSLRDAEMMLDQLSLLGRKITVPLVYEVNGVVSDDELLDLLRVALSCDVPNTVKKSRELMRSRIDPLQLVAQLANLIMDLLAGNSTTGVGTKLFGADISEANMQQLSQALKILSQAEKQLRTSKNQTTWLTAALLQLSSGGSSLDTQLNNLQSTHSQPQDGDLRSTSSTNESLKHPVPHSCEDIELGMGLQEDRETLELVWKRATGLCTPNSLKKFLWKHGKLVSIRLAYDAGIAMVELEFNQAGYISRAEKSWKIIAGALQHVLGYNVELTINLACNDFHKNGKLKKSNFNLFNCSKRANLRSKFAAERGSNASDISDSAPGKMATRDKYVETRSSGCRSHGKGLLNIIRSNEGNAISVGATALNGDDNRVKGCSAPNEDGDSTECPHSVSPRYENKHRRMEFLKLHCWNTAVFPFRKVRQLRNMGRNKRLESGAAES